MVVWMNRCLAPKRCAGDLRASVGDDLVYVHVELGAAAGHPDMQREHVMMLSGEDLVTGLSDKFELLIAQPFASVVSRRGAFLQGGISCDHFTRNQVFADAEMFQRTLSLSAPELVRGYFNCAQAVRFLPHVLHVHFSLFLPSFEFDLSSKPKTIRASTPLGFRSSTLPLGKAMADRNEAWSTPRRRHLGALDLHRSIGRDVCTKSGFPARSCRIRLDRVDTSNLPSLHKCCDSPRCRYSALPRSCNPHSWREATRNPLRFQQVRQMHTGPHIHPRRMCTNRGGCCGDIQFLP